MQHGAEVRRNVFWHIQNGRQTLCIGSGTWVTHRGTCADWPVVPSKTRQVSYSCTGQGPGSIIAQRSEREDGHARQGLAHGSSHLVRNVLHHGSSGRRPSLTMKLRRAGGGHNWVFRERSRDLDPGRGNRTSRARTGEFMFLFSFFGAMSTFGANDLNERISRHVDRIVADSRHTSENQPDTYGSRRR